MLDAKLIKAVKPYRELNLNDEMNLINIFQGLSRDFSQSLPLKKDDIQQAIMQRLAELGLNTDNLLLSKKDLYYNLKHDTHKWANFHSQISFKETTTSYPVFESLTYDKTMMALVLAPTYQNKNMPAFQAQAANDKATADMLKVIPKNDFDTELFDFYLLIPIDEQLIDLFVLLKLCDQQTHVLNSTLLQWAAKLIYVQQSSISISVNNTKQLKDVQYDFGKATNDFLSHFRIPETTERDEVPTIHITELIKYMHDVLNDKPVDSELFNLITKGKFDTESKNIIINQARQLGLDNVLSPASDKEVAKIKHDLSKSVAKKVRRVWVINNQKSNQSYRKDAKHMVAVHGTQNLSVLNILGEGLLDSDSLREQGSTHFTYTGSGFGRGIYFARLDQADKSYNYTEDRADGDEIFSYMFLADIAYTKIKHTEHYGASNNKDKTIDIVWGDGVGSYDRDEIVAKHPEQVQIKYLLELN